MLLSSYLLIPIAAISLALTYLLTTFSFYIKIIGSINGLKTKSWNLSSAILLANSFFIAIALTTIGFILDSNPELEIILIIFIIDYLIILTGHLILKNWPSNLFTFFKKIINFYFKFNLKTKYIGDKRKLFEIDKPSFFAWLCLLVGFLFPSILAVQFNEYRATLFQLSFIFNSIGTFLTVLYTERRASIYTDKVIMKKDEIYHAYEYFLRVINSRIYTSGIMFIFLLLSIILINN